MSTKSLFKKLEKELGRMTFGSVLKSWRQCEEQSLDEFATILGISKTSLYELETGKRIPSPKRASKVAKKIGLPESTLIELAIQDTLYKQGFKYDIKIKTA